MRTALQNKVLLVFIAITIGVVGCGVLTFVTTRHLLYTWAEIEKIERVVDTLDGVLSTLKDAETGQRGYLITGNGEYLEPYWQALSAIGLHMKRLETLLSSDAERSDFRNLNHDVNAELRSLSQGIHARRTHGFEAARALVVDGMSKRVMDDIRREIRRERNLRVAREHALDASGRNVLRKVQVAWSSLAALIVLSMAFTFWQVRRDRLNWYARRALEHEATHDRLTGLPNRAFFYSWLPHAIERAKREGLVLAVLFLDLDGFKKINDDFGHADGDRLLTEVARRFRHAVRGSDVLARFGGDEFTVALLMKARGDVVPVSERLIVSLEGSTSVALNRDTPLGVSIGIAFFPDDGGDPDSLVRAADRAMYRAKAGGGRRFHYFAEKITSS